MQIGRRALVVAALALGGLLVSGAPALAHNSLTASDPEDGARMEHGPDEVRLTFRQSLDPLNADVAVAGPDGGSAVTGEPVFEGSTVTIPVRTDAAGAYEVAYEVLSEDGDWVDGTVEFTVTVGVRPTQPASTPAPAPTTIAAVDPVASQTETDSGGSGPAWWVWALVALAVAVGAGYGGYRLRRRSAG